MSLTAAAGQVLDWSFGLKGVNGKYLTAETFQSKLSNSASVMKKKEIWFLQQESSVEYCYIQSHLKTYLQIDSAGQLKCSAEKDDECKLIIEAQNDGRWCFKSLKYGWYFKSPNHDRCAFEAAISEEHHWTINLALHPQICLFNLNRKSYMHLSDKGDSLTIDERVPWGDDATITLVFFDDDGSYGLQASNGKFLQASGSLTDEPGADTRFVLVFNSGNISFRSKANGKFLTGLGANGVSKATKSAVSKDELFHMEDSFPQLKFTSSNGMKVSVSQGVELAAKSKDTTDTEIFQVEPVGNNQWTFKTNQEKYWTLADNASVQAVATVDDLNKDETKFTIEWKGPNVAIKASNGKYLSQHMNAYIKADSDSASDDNRSLFVYEMVNRPRLVLRTEYGFINTQPSGILECNKSHPEVYKMEVTKGFCKISTNAGKYWKADKTSVAATGTAPEAYTIELHENSKLCLVANGSDYFQANQNGALTTQGTGPDKFTLFEY